MKRSRWRGWLRSALVAGLLVAGVGLAAACGGSQASSPSAQTATDGDAAGRAAPAGPGANPGAPPAEGPTVARAGKSSRPYLVGPSGLMLYVFANDQPGESYCTDGCAGTWPPLTVAAATAPTAGPDVGGSLSVITRDDGTQQVALDGAPLYYYVGDAAPGDQTGDGLGGVWAVARPPAGAPSTSGASEGGY